MAFTANDVKDLREKTGCGMMDCKKALIESDGDMGKAMEYLREKGLAVAAKKAGRIAAEGMVYASVFENGVGVSVEVNSETDFVAKNEGFQKFVADLAKVIALNNPSDVEALSACAYPDSALTVDAMLKEKILTIGENLKIRRFDRFDNGVSVAYIHGGGRIGVLVEFDTDASMAKNDEFLAFGKDIAMQIAALNPQYLNRESVPEDVVKSEMDILMVQALNEGKPAQVAQKIVEGRINKFYQQSCLVEQEYVKDSDMKVKKYVEETGKKLGVSIKINRYSRFEKGEGIEKKVDDLAAEVSKLVK